MKGPGGARDKQLERGGCKGMVTYRDFARALDWFISLSHI